MNFKLIMLLIGILGLSFTNTTISPNKKEKITDKKNKKLDEEKKIINTVDSSVVARELVIKDLMPLDLIENFNSYCNSCSSQKIFTKTVLGN